MKRVLPFQELPDHALIVEFFDGGFEGTKFAMLRVGELGYYARYTPEGIEVMPTKEYSSHIAFHMVGAVITQITSFVTFQAEGVAQ